MVFPSKITTNVEGRQDRISNLPVVLIDKILELLPLNEAAMMSVLSKQWRTNLCCLTKLVFDQDFSERQFCNKDGDQKLKWETYISTVSNIFLHHHGPIHEFYLDIPTIPHETLNLNPWLRFLSRNGVKKITLINCMKPVHLPSHIYSCIELDELILTMGFTVKRPPTDFEVFKQIFKLEFMLISFEGDILQSLIAKCPKLTILTLRYCSYHNTLVIDAPKLENLTLSDSPIGFLKFKNVPNLAKLDLCWYNKSITDREADEVADAIKNLAASCDLKSLHLRDFMSTLFLGIEKWKSFPLALTHLYELSLGVLDLDDFGGFSCTFGYLRSRPFIKKLPISVGRPWEEVEVEHNYDYDNNYKLGNLVEVDIDGVTGSKPELKLIEYVLSASTILQQLTVNFGTDDYVTELKLQRKLNGFRRASPKAQIVFM